MSMRALWVFSVLLVPISCVEAPETPAVPVAETLASGAPLRGANGIHFGPDGRLYVASVATPAIAIMNPETGEIERLLGPEDGVQGPDDLAFGPDGSLYWTDISVGTVGRRSPDGTVTVVADLGPGPNPVTLSDDGRLFVSQCFFDDRLWELDPDGEEEPRLIRDDLGPGCGLNGMDWGPDGRLYGPRWFLSEVVAIDVDSGDMETVADGFGTAAAVKFDSHGRLHVLDTLAGEVVRIEGTSREIVGRFQEASADNLAFSVDDRLFVSSYADGFILEVLSPEENRLVSPGGINIPGGISLSAEGDRLWLADFFALRALDPSTGEELYAERDVLGRSEIGSVMNVHDWGESVLITSWFDNQVKVWDPRANRITARYESFANPMDALPFADRIFVSEFGAARVVSFSPLSPEDRTTVAEGFRPAGLASHGGSLYVADYDGGRVVKIADQDELLAGERVVATDLEGPEGVAVARDGTVYVVEALADRVTRIRPDGSQDIIIAALDLNVPARGAFPATMLFNGIAAGDDVLFVTGDKGNVIYKIAL